MGGTDGQLRSVRLDFKSFSSQLFYTFVYSDVYKNIHIGPKGVNPDRTNLDKIGHNLFNFREKSGWSQIILFWVRKLLNPVGQEVSGRRFALLQDDETGKDYDMMIH